MHSVVDSYEKKIISDQDIWWFRGRYAAKEIQIARSIFLVISYLQPEPLLESMQPLRK